MCPGDGSCVQLTALNASVACFGLISCRCTPAPACPGVACTGNCNFANLLDGRYNALLSLYRFLGLVRAKGMNVDNAFVTPDGDMQLLVLDGVSDPRLVPNASGVVLDALSFGFRTPFNATILIDPLVGTSRAYLARLGADFWIAWVNTSCAQLLAGRGFKLLATDLQPANYNATIWVAPITYIPPGTISDQIIHDVTLSALVDYVTNLLALPADCFEFGVPISNTSLIEVQLHILQDAGCTLPAPFWGACCRQAAWYSSADKNPTLSDLAATPTQIYHNGSLNLDNVAVFFDSAILNVTNGLNATSGAQLALGVSLVSVGVMNLTDGAVVTTTNESSLIAVTGFTMDATTSVSVATGALVSLPAGATLSGTVILPGFGLAQRSSPYPFANVSGANSTGFATVLTPQLTPKQVSNCRQIFKSTYSQVPPPAISHSDAAAFHGLRR
jgi:hypothetical protein